MNEKSPEGIMRAWFEEIWTHDKRDEIRSVMAPGIVAHNVHDAGGDVVGPEGFEAFFDGIRTAFPDLRFTVEDVFACGAKVVGRWRMTGTHHGPFQGIAPTGKPVNITGMAIALIKDGQVHEAWDEWDRLGLMVQLGLFQPPASRAG